ncbi:hypothetical protein Acsp06_34190 [Actinomycetospora sp. NBRC 106375]|nr:hypothetical protein Acsp06_34190 [Actinomycetospora sp. NBRC 106375]
MRILARGTVQVLGAVAAVSALAGLVTLDPLVALNALGFIGICALSCVAVFYSVALERIGLTRARNAASTLVTVFAGSAATMAVLFVLLVTRTRFRHEASEFGLHSVAGLAVLAVLVAVVTVMWRER